MHIKQICIILTLLTLTLCGKAQQPQGKVSTGFIYVEDYIVKNGISGINIVFDVYTENLENHRLKITAFFEPQESNPIKVISEEANIINEVTPVIENQRFFIPYSRLPQKKGVVRAQIDDISVSPAKYLGYHMVRHYTKPVSIPVTFDFSHIPTEINKSKNIFYVGISGLPASSSIKVAVNDSYCATFYSNGLHTFNTPDFEVGINYITFEYNGRKIYRVINKKRKFVAANIKFSHVGDKLRITYDLFPLISPPLQNTIGACVWIYDYTKDEYVKQNGQWVKWFRRLGILNLSSPLREQILEVPFSEIPNEYRNSKMKYPIEFYEYTHQEKNNGWEVLDTFWPNPIILSELSTNNNDKKLDDPSKAIIEWIDLFGQTQSRIINIKAGVRSKSKITAVELLVNGQVSRGINNVQNDGYDMTISHNITLSEGTNNIKLVVTNSAGTTEDVRTIIYTPIMAQKPMIIWKNFTNISKSKTYNLNVSVESSSKIEYANVYINGQLERGIIVSQTTSGDMDIIRTITLKEGQNQIKIEVKNKDGISTMAKSVTYTPQSIIPATINQKRLALVIGNSNYTNATKLPNPAHDATDVASKLRSLGFEVIEKHDLTIKTFKSTIRDFGAKASYYDASVVYYAGHAIERNGKNYLIPIDATIEVASDIEDECVRADYIIDNLEEAKSKMNIIVLDACRNNPINRSWARSMNGGLSSMIAPTGTFIAFSTAPGHTAADGDGRNSPFTEAFLRSLDKPNLQLELFFKEVLRDVSIKTSNRQIPWTQSSFLGDFYFNIK